MDQARCLDLEISLDGGIPDAGMEYPKYTCITPELKLHVESLLQLRELLTLHLRPTDVRVQAVVLCG